MWAGVQAAVAVGRGRGVSVGAAVGSPVGSAVSVGVILGAGTVVDWIIVGVESSYWISTSDASQAVKESKTSNSRAELTR